MQASASIGQKLPLGTYVKIVIDAVMDRIPDEWIRFILDYAEFLKKYENDVSSRPTIAALAPILSSSLGDNKDLVSWFLRNRFEYCVNLFRATGCGVMRMVACDLAPALSVIDKVSDVASLHEVTVSKITPSVTATYKCSIVLDVTSNVTLLCVPRVPLACSFVRRLLLHAIYTSISFIILMTLLAITVTFAITINLHVACKNVGNGLESFKIKEEYASIGKKWIRVGQARGGMSRPCDSETENNASK